MTQINAKTSLPLTYVIAICGFMFWIGSEVHSIRVMMQSAWTVHDMGRWENQAAALNPSVKFPDAYAIVGKRN